MVSIYDYLDPNHFLRDIWEEKRTVNPSFSVRTWARQLGMKVHGPLHQMIHDKRKIPKKHVSTLIQILDLSMEEGQYFEALVDLKKTQDETERNYFLNRLKDISPFPELNVLKSQMIEHFRDPLSFVILEMTVLKEFKNDVEWISGKLHHKVSPERVSGIIENLTKLGYLEASEDETRGIKRVHTNVYGQDIPSKAVIQNHQKASEMAKNAVELQPADKREFISFSLNIAEEKLPKAKQMLREFHRLFAEQVEASEHEGDKTYNINFQLFEATR